MEEKERRKYDKVYDISEYLSGNYSELCFGYDTWKRHYTDNFVFRWGYTIAKIVTSFYEEGVVTGSWDCDYEECCDCVSCKIYLYSTNSNDDISKITISINSYEEEADFSYIYKGKEEKYGGFDLHNLAHKIARAIESSKKPHIPDYGDTCLCQTEGK